MMLSYCTRPLPFPPTASHADSPMPPPPARPHCLMTQPAMPPSDDAAPSARPMPSNNQSQFPADHSSALQFSGPSTSSSQPLHTYTITLPHSSTLTTRRRITIPPLGRRSDLIRCETLGPQAQHMGFDSRTHSTLSASFLMIGPAIPPPSALIACMPPPVSTQDHAANAQDPTRSNRLVLPAARYVLHTAQSRLPTSDVYGVVVGHT